MPAAIGYVRLQLSGIEAEARLFQALPHLETVVISGEQRMEEMELSISNRRECALNRNPLDYLLGFLFRGNPSPIRMITLDHMEEHIRSVEAVNAVELYSLLAYDVCRIAAKSRIPVVTSIWETISNHPIQTLVPYAICVREVMKKTTLFVAYTTRAAAYLDSQGVDQERIRVVYPGLDLDRKSVV